MLNVSDGPDLLEVELTPSGRSASDDEQHCSNLKPHSLPYVAKL